MAIFLSQAGPESAAPQTLTRILHNICSQPHNPKFRSLKMSNAKIRACVLEAPGALELLEVKHTTCQSWMSSTLNILLMLQLTAPT